jgi:SAM-dependent methyltransferase
VALAAYCARVYGVDPSAAMLERATAHDRITYRSGAAEQLPLPDESVDVATCAGVLPHVDRAAAAAEVQRVGRPGALVVPYDFEVHLDDVLRDLDVSLPPPNPDYDHAANLSGVAGFTEERMTCTRVELTLTAAELAHLLLGDQRRYEALARTFDVADPFPKLKERLAAENAPRSVGATLYVSVYRRAAP